MTDRLSTLLHHLTATAEQGVFNRFRRGLEKETLRVSDQGQISQTDHPRTLGSALTHPHITTDYSEALLEFITPVNTSRHQTLDFLLDLHRFTLARLGEGELLWPASMPCRLSGNASVRIAEYGHSHVGQMKHIYRHGLDWRYGRIMQSIAGMHYNFSLPDELWQALATYEGDPELAQQSQWRSARYFGLIRNFRRYTWLLMLLFGASPAVDESFLAATKNHRLTQLGEATWGLPWATSLRMSDLGYQNSVQSSLRICFNSLTNYINTLQQAIRTPHPAYVDLGVKVDGVYRQLNTSILQIENEYYSSIRPKRVSRSGQSPSDALKQGGVEYIEVRCLDINPFLPGGIDAAQMRFLDSFLLFCLLKDSPILDDDACRRVDQNMQRVVTQGRHPDTHIWWFEPTRNDRERPIQEAASDLLAQLRPLACLLDQGLDAGETLFSQALDQQEARVMDFSLTPSARMLALISETGSHQAAVLQLARAQREQLLTCPMEKSHEALFSTQVATSLQEQQALEAASEGDFDQYLARTLG